MPSASTVSTVLHSRRLLPFDRSASHYRTLNSIASHYLPNVHFIVLSPPPFHITLLPPHPSNSGTKGFAVTYPAPQSIDLNRIWTRMPNRINKRSSFSFFLSLSRSPFCPLTHFVPLASLLIALLSFLLPRVPRASTLPCRLHSFMGRPSTLSSLPS
jgi:hypothetical protein